MNNMSLIKILSIVVGVACAETAIAQEVGIELPPVGDQQDLVCHTTSASTSTGASGQFTLIIHGAREDAFAATSITLSEESAGQATVIARRSVRRITNLTAVEICNQGAICVLGTSQNYSEVLYEGSGFRALRRTNKDATQTYFDDVTLALRKNRVWTEYEFQCAFVSAPVEPINRR